MKTKTKISAAASLALFFAACLEPVGPPYLQPGGLAEGLNLKVLPAVTQYSENMPFMTAGIKVVFVDGGWEKDVTGEVGYSWEKGTLQDGGTEVTADPGEKDITVSYKGGGPGHEVVFRITVVPSGLFNGIVITGLPAQRQYGKGEPFRIAGNGIEVTLFSDGLASDISDKVTYRWSGGDLAEGNRDVTADHGRRDITVSYGQGMQAVYGIEVVKVLEGLFITAVPETATEYGRGEPFDPAGIEVTLFRGGLASEVSGEVTYSWSGGDINDVTADHGRKKIDVKHPGGDTFFRISVRPDPLDGLKITSLPKQTDYRKNEVFSSNGIQVMLFSGGGAQDVSGKVAYSWSGGNLIPGSSTDVTADFGTKEITVRHPSGEETSFCINVVPDPGSPGEKISIDSLPVLTEYPVNEKFTVSGMKVTLHGDGWTRDVSGEVTYWYKGREVKPGDTWITGAGGARYITVSWDPQDGSPALTDKDSFRIEVLANHFIVRETQDWINTVTGITGDKLDRSYTITVTGDVGVDGSSGPVFPGRTGITVTLQTLRGESARLFLLSAGSMADIDGIQTLVIDGDLTLSGYASNDSPLLVIGNGAVLDLRRGTLEGNTNTAGDGGGVSVSGGRFVMSGGKVSANTALRGGGVYLRTQSSFEMSGGEVGGNTATVTNARTGGGGVNVDGGSSFVMSGRSSVAGNSSGAAGGGIMIEAGCTVTMTDESSVKNNRATGQVGSDGLGGGGIYLGTQSTEAKLILKGGTISGNYARFFGGGVFAFIGSLVQISDGIIYGRDAAVGDANDAGGSGPAEGDAMFLRYPGSSSQAQYGTFEANGNFVMNGRLSDMNVDDTVEVVNGIPQ